MDLLTIAAISYFIPSVIAWMRRHRNENSIFLTNLFLGWTFLGWVVALVWAVSDNCRPAPVPTEKQINKSRRDTERLNWMIGAFFGTIAVLVGTAICGLGVRLIIIASIPTSSFPPSYEDEKQEADLFFDTRKSIPTLKEKE